jgi:hypothetical protein
MTLVWLAWLQIVEQDETTSDLTMPKGKKQSCWPEKQYSRKILLLTVRTSSGS